MTQSTSLTSQKECTAGYGKKMQEQEHGIGESIIYSSSTDFLIDRVAQLRGRLKEESGMDVTALDVERVGRQIKEFAVT